MNSTGPQPRSAPCGAGRFFSGAQDFIGGARFAAFLLALLVTGNLVLLALLFVPRSPTALGEFAESFRAWCLAYDPGTGKYEWAYALPLVSQPFLFAAAILFLWGGALRKSWREERRRLMAPAVAGTMAVLLGSGAMFFFGSSPETPAAPTFPGERIRTAIPAPDFTLFDQAGETTTLAAQKGRVVLVTGFYASCGHTCPVILTELKRVVKPLADSRPDDIRVLALTFDPGNDKTEVLRRVSSSYGFDTPIFHLLSGDSGSVNQALDNFAFARIRDPKTGVIDHANLFILVDRGGKIAFRFTLGERQESWLTEALELLLKEGELPPS